MKKSIRKDKMFISLNENDKESISIADQIDKYFTSWGFDCIIIRNRDYEKKKNVDDIIDRALGSSNYFLQILTDGTKTRYMKSEWETWQTLHRAKKIKHNKPIVLFKDSFKKPEGRYHSVRMDDETQVDHFFAGILTHKLPKNHGRIVPPPCFCARKTDKLVFTDIDDLLKFIMSFKEVHDRGLIRIYPDKQSTIEPLKKKLVELQTGDEVRMLGFTLKRFVVPDKADPKESIGVYFNAAIDRGTTARLLLLDRNCQAAYERAGIESHDKKHDDSLLVTDSNKVVKHVSDMKNKDRVTIFYHKTPYCGIVLFKDEVFVEIYHIGDHLKSRDLCGKVPVISIKRGFDLYEYFDSHFKNNWNINCGNNEKIKAFYDMQKIGI